MRVAVCFLVLVYFALLEDVIDQKAFTTSVFHRCLSKETTVVKSLPSKNLVRLTQNLIRVIEVAMNASDSATQLAIDTVMPWILLYRLLHQ